MGALINQTLRYHVYYLKDPIMVFTQDDYTWALLLNVDNSHGHIDMNDGTLQKKYKRYRERLAFIGVLGMKDMSDATVQNFSTAVKDIEEDISHMLLCVCFVWNSLRFRGYTRSPLQSRLTDSPRPSTRSHDSSVLSETAGMLTLALEKSMSIMEK